MKLTWIGMMGCALVLAGSPALRAENKDQKTNKDGPVVVAAEKLVLAGTIDDVGKITRTVTIKTDDGEKVRFKAGPEVLNFDQLKEGDRVAISYLGSVAVDVQKPNKPFRTSGSSKYQVAGPGQKPADVYVGTEEVGVQVVDIDKNKRMLKVREPDGKERELKADEALIDLDQIQIGDQIVIRFSEALAFDIQPQNKK